MLKGGSFVHNVGTHEMRPQVGACIFLRMQLALFEVLLGVRWNYHFLLWLPCGRISCVPTLWVRPLNTQH